jgi:uncharacterized protein (TIGR02246 family)
MTTLKRRGPTAVAALAAAALVCVLAARPFGPAAAGQPSNEVAGPAKDPPAEEAAVRKAAADYVAAMTAGDPDAILAFWADDADYIAEDGTITRGKTAIADLYKASLPWPKGTKYAGKANSIKFLRGEIALEDGELTATTPDGATESNRYSIVWTKTGGRWVLSRVRDLPAGVTGVPSAGFPQLQGLQWLVGEWHDDSPEKDVTLTCRWSENKAFLLMDYRVRRADAEPLVVQQRIGWDPVNGVVRSWVFDSDGGFGEGDWARDGRSWNVEAAGVLPDGGTGGARHRYEVKDENTFVWRATDREIDGLPVADAEVKFVRAGAKKEGGAR